MNKKCFVPAVAVFFCLLLIDAGNQAFGQIYQTWRDPDASTGNWHQANAWWNFPNGSSIVSGQQQWNNNHYTSQTNNNGGNQFSTWQWVFQSGASNVHTFGGDAVRFFDNSGTDPMIQNESGATHIINNNISGDGDSADPFSININGAGGLTFGGTVNNQGGVINVGGSTASAATVRFNGVVSGSGGMYVNNGNLTVLMDAANTQSGQLTINAGTVRLNASGDSFGGSAQAIRVGTNAVLDLNNVSTTVGSVGEEGNNDGGSVSLGNATLTVGGDSYNTFQNGVTGTGALVKSGSGTLNLYGTVSYTGSTAVNGGVLNSAVAMSTAGVTVSSGTFGTTAANVLGDSVGVTVNGGVYRVGGSDTVGVLSGSGGEVSVTNGTLTTSFNGASNNYAGVVSGAGAFTKSGTGTLVFSGGSANTISGGLTVSSGALILNKTAGVAAVSSAVTVSSGATLSTLAANQFGNNLATVNGTLNLADNNQSLALRGAGTVSLGGATLTNKVGISDTFSGHITGTGAIVKADVGEAFFSGSNNYSGLTTVSAGTLEIQNAHALGATNAGTLVSDGAILKLFNASAMTVAESITINGTTGDGSLRNVGGSNTISGTITLGLNSRIGSSGGGSLQLGAINATNRVLYMGGANNIAATGPIGGTGASEGGTTTTLYKDGVGTLTLSGNNSYSGDTRVVQGTLTVASGGNLGDGTSDVFIAQSTNTAVLNINSASKVGSVILSTNGTLNINANTEVASISEVGTGNGGTASIGSGASLTVSGGGSVTNYMNSISGAGGLVRSGTGTLALYGAQSYTGATTVSGGKLYTATALSTGGLTVSGGTFESGAANILGNAIAVSVSGGTYSLGGSDQIGSFEISGGALSGAHTLTASSYALNGGNINAVLGAGAITVGGGTNTLGSAGRLNSGSSLTVNSGQITLGGNEAVSSLAGTGGTVNLGANSLTLGGNSYSNRFDGVISGNGSLIKNGTGTLSLAGINTYTGGTLLNAGYLDSESTNAFGTGSITVASAGTLDLQSHSVANLIINNGGIILSSGTVSDVVASNGTTSIGGSNSVVVDATGSATVNVSGSNVTVSNVSGSAAVNIGGTDATVDNVSGGTVTLSNTATGSSVNAASAGTVNAAAANVNVGTVSGTAAVNLAGTGAQVTTVSGGTVTLSNTATGSRVDTASAGTVNANATGVNVGTISNTATVNVGGANGRVTTMAGGAVNANAAGLVISNKTGGNIAISNGVTVGLRSGNSSGVISGSGGVAKQGATTLTLSGVNTYSGGTAVEQGKLVVNGSANSSAVTVGSGATIGGGGSILSLTLNGMLAPGNSAGTTTALSGATWNQGGSYDWEIYDLAGPSGTGWDLLSVTGGTLDLTGITGPGGFTINLITLQGDNTAQGALTGFNASTSYLTGWMIASAPTITGFVASEFNLNSTLFAGATGTFAIEQRAISGGQGLFVTYNGGGSEAIPEPGTWAAAVLLAGAAGYVRWRRRRDQKQDA